MSNPSVPESFLFDDGRLKSASYDSGQGFGLRVVSGETTGYAHASEISEASSAVPQRQRQRPSAGGLDCSPLGQHR